MKVARARCSSGLCSEARWHPPRVARHQAWHRHAGQGTWQHCLHRGGLRPPSTHHQLLLQCTDPVLEQSSVEGWLRWSPGLGEGIQGFLQPEDLLRELSDLHGARRLPGPLSPGSTGVPGQGQSQGFLPPLLLPPLSVSVWGGKKGTARRAACPHAGARAHVSACALTCASVH